MTAAHHLERMLAERGLRASHESGQAHFYVSDVPDSFVQTADLFLGEYKAARWSRSPLINIDKEKQREQATEGRLYHPH